jgi:hypothetical protein
MLWWRDDEKRRLTVKDVERRLRRSTAVSGADAEVSERPGSDVVVVTAGGI